MADDEYLADIESKLEALRLRLPDLEGKANKRERTQVNKDIAALENDERAAEIRRNAKDAGAAAAKAEVAAEAAAGAAEADAQREAAAKLKKKKKKIKDAPWEKLTADGGVQKQLKIEGDEAADGEDEFPPEGAIVSVSYRGRFNDADGAIFETSPDEKPFSFTVGDGRVLAGWDIGVRTMRKGERCGLLLQPQYAYGKEGTKGIPGGSTLHFEMILEEFI